MDFESLLLFPPTLCGPIFMLTGWIMWKFPPKKINIIYGYKTANSMKSQERWDFSQGYAAKELIKWGGMLTLTSSLVFFVDFSKTTAMVLGIGFIILVINLMLTRTEKAILKKFERE